MDFLLPDDEAIKKMTEEYSGLRMSPEGIAAALGLNAAQVKPMGETIAKSDFGGEGLGVRGQWSGLSEKLNLERSDAASPLSTLYSSLSQSKLSTILIALAFVLGYNLGHGTAIHDSDRGLGRLQPCKGTFRDVNHLFSRS